MAGPLVAILSGAGISTESGIPDYRGPNGLWRRDPEAEKLATYEYYMADPEIRRRSWQARRAIWAPRPEPNAAHRAIADLDRSGVPVRVITQNVDGLHQRAGMPGRKVLELHGSTQERGVHRVRREDADAGRAGPARGGRAGPAVPGLRRDPEDGHGDVRRGTGPGRCWARPPPSPGPAR